MPSAPRHLPSMFPFAKGLCTLSFLLDQISSPSPSFQRLVVSAVSQSSHSYLSAPVFLSLLSQGNRPPFAHQPVTPDFLCPTGSQSVSIAGSPQSCRICCLKISPIGTHLPQSCCICCPKIIAHHLPTIRPPAEMLQTFTFWLDLSL